MTFSKYTFYFILILLFTQCKTQQFRVGNYSGSKCYAKSLIVYDEEKQLIQEVNLSEDDENAEYVIKEIVTEPKTTKWVKKKADRDCLSADPNDCLVWCLVEVQPVTRKVRVRVDSGASNEIYNDTIQSEFLVEKRILEWKEVVCESDITTALINRIQDRLRELKYYEDVNTGELNQFTKDAIIKFQKENKLPIGQLDFETLDVMSIGVY